MNRNETFPGMLVNTLTVHLAWASVEMMVDEVEDIQVLISGSDADVNDLKLICENGRLLVEQPTYGLTYKINTVRWMQVFIRLPQDWKGAVDASTISGPLKARGLSGTDMVFDTVTGDLRATNIQSITTTLRTVSGNVLCETLRGEHLGLRAVSGNITCDGCAFDTYRLSTVNGMITMDMERPFDKLDGATVSGNIRVNAPMTQADAVLRSASGRIRTNGISIQQDAPPATISSVSGNFELNCSLQAADENGLI